MGGARTDVRKPMPARLRLRGRLYEHGTMLQPGDLLRRLLCTLLPILLLGSQPASATPAPSAERPKIGLVLGGGGAKGAAHVGVIKVLEEMGVPIDVIAGTSFGAIVGGLYASGMPVAEIENQIRSIDWKDVFDDAPPRPDRPFRRKQDDEDYLIKRKPGFNDGKLQLPVGVVQGQKFDLILNRLTLPVATVHDFDALPIPFRAVASDLETGEKVVLGSGELAVAIRASMAVPGAFRPVNIDGRVLVDGAISANVPIDVARAMGADVVIVVDLGDPLKTADELDSVLAVIGQLSAMLTSRNVQEQLATLGRNDIYIKPDLRDLGVSSFTKAAEGIEYGEEAAHGMAESLRRYALSPRVYQAHLAARNTPPARRYTVDTVRFDNRSTLSDAMLTERLQVNVGEPLNVMHLEEGIEKIYGLDVFESVRYRLEDTADGTELVVTADEKRWGPNYLQFGAALSDDFDGDNAWDFAVSYLKTNINSLGGEIRIAGQIGQRPLLFGELYQPLDAATRYFLRPRVLYLAQNIGIFENAEQLQEFRTTSVGAEISGGRLFGNDAELALGFTRLYGDAEQRIGSPKVPETSFDIADLFVSLSYDTLNNRNFPTRGIIVNGEWRDSIESLGANNNVSQFELGGSLVHSLGDHTFIAGAQFATTLHGSGEIQNRFVAGGFTDLSGFAEDELSGTDVALLGAVYYKRLRGISLVPVYAGISIEYGNVFEDSSEISFAPEDAILAGSAFVGVDTLLGPLYLAYGHAERGNDSLYFFLGRIF